MIYGKRVRLFPTKEQQQLLFGSCGVTRFAYNRSKAVSERYYRMFGKGLPDKHWRLTSQNLKNDPLLRG